MFLLKSKLIKASELVFNLVKLTALPIIIVLQLRLDISPISFKYLPPYTSISWSVADGNVYVNLVVSPRPTLLVNVPTSPYSLRNLIDKYIGINVWISKNISPSLLALKVI